MRFSKPKYQKPVTGVGVFKLGKNRFSVDVQFKDAKGNEDSENFSFQLSDLPEDLPETFELKNGSSYFWNIRADGSAINSARPAKGMFSVVCTGIAKDDKDNFLVMEKLGQYGKYWQIVANLVVTDGNATDIVFPLYLPFAGTDSRSGDRFDRFVADDDGNFTIVGSPDKSKAVAQLFDFIEYAGLSDVEIPFPDSDDEQDVLAVFSKALRKGKHEFMIIVEKGYVKSMASINDDESDDDEDVEVTPIVKKKVVVDEDDDEEVVETKSSKKLPVAVDTVSKAMKSKVAVEDDDKDEEVMQPKKKSKRPQFQDD